MKVCWNLLNLLMYTLEVLGHHFLLVGFRTIIILAGVYHHPKGTTIFLMVVDFQGIYCIYNKWSSKKNPAPTLCIENLVFLTDHFCYWHVTYEDDTGKGNAKIKWLIASGREPLYTAHIWCTGNMRQTVKSWREFFTTWRSFWSRGMKKLPKCHVFQKKCNSKTL